MPNSNVGINPFQMIGANTQGVDPGQLNQLAQTLGPDFFSGLLGQSGHGSGNPFGQAMIKQFQQPGALQGLIGNPGLANLKGDTGNRSVQIMNLLQQAQKKPKPGVQPSAPGIASL